MIRDKKPDFSGVTSRVDTSADTVGRSTYTAQRGDTPSAIAKQHYDEAKARDILFAANRDVLDDPDRVQPGQTVRIPPYARR